MKPLPILSSAIAVLFLAVARQAAAEAAASPAPIEVKGRAYYVSPDGSRKANGLTPETPTAAQKAEELSKPGDVIYFLEGEYVYGQGSRALTIEHSGEAGMPIIYTPAPGAKVTLRNNGAWEAIKVVGASYIEIRGLRVVGDAESVTHEEATQEMSNPKNPRTCGNGIAIDKSPKTQTPSSHITVRDCTVSYLPGGGIYMSHSDYITFENNMVFRCAFWSPYGNSGLSMYQPTAVDENTTDYKLIIRNNVSFENYENIPFIFSNKADPAKRKVTDGNGIILDDFLCTQRWGGGSGKAYTGRTLVANNVVFGNGGSGIHAFKSCNADIVQNDASDNNRHPTLKDGQIFAHQSKNVRILNNILVAPAGKPVTTVDKNENVLIDFNVFANLDGTTPFFQCEQGNNIVASPGLELIGWAEGGRTFKAAPDSPLRAAGMPLPDAGPDFFGKPRGDGKPDIGPFVLEGH